MNNECGICHLITYGNILEKKLIEQNMFHWIYVHYPLCIHKIQFLLLKKWKILLSLHPKCVIWDLVDVIHVLTSALSLKQWICWVFTFTMHSTVCNSHFLCSFTFLVCFKLLIFPFSQHVELLNLLWNLCDVKVTILQSHVSENECGLPSFLPFKT